MLVSQVDLSLYRPFCRIPSSAEIINPALRSVPVASGDQPSLHLKVSLESELAVTGNGTEISDFLLYLCSDAMLTRRGGWELSSSASFCAALLLLHVAVVLPGVVSSQSLKNSKLTATSLWLTLSGASLPLLLFELSSKSDPFLCPSDYLFYSGDTPLVIAKGGFSVAQAILSRSNKFDASLFPILTVEDLVAQVKPAKLWLNIQHDIFYRQLNLDMRSGYVESYTSVVMDAHREGLEVFASEFANDVLFSYNYSYDPLAEVLSFIDNGIFSVDGGCDRLPHNRIRGHRLQVTWHSDVNVSNPVEIEVGKLGYSLSCSRIILFLGNLAKRCYSHVNMSNSDHDGADYIDRPVQGTKDGILMCMSSINLMEATTVTTSPFSSLSPDKDLSGILIGIENAAFLAEKLGYSVTDGVMRALQDSGYGNQTGQEVMILSKNSSVLIKFRQQTKSNSGDKYVWMVSSLSTLGQLQHIEIEAGKTETENKDVIDCWMLEKMNSVEKLNEINAMYEDMMQQLKVSSVKQLAQQQADGIINQREAGYVDHVKSTVQSSCKHTIRAHEGGCGSILFQLNSDKLISGCQDRTVKIWDTKSGTLSSTLHDCLGSVLDLAITHDNRFIIAASSSNNLSCLGSGDRLLPQYHYGWTGNQDWTVKIWDTKVCAVDASKVSSCNLVSAAYDHTMKVWDLVISYCPNTITFQSNCNSISYSMDDFTFCSGHVDGNLRFWDSRMGKVVSEVAAHSQAVIDLRIPKRKLVADKWKRQFA
ncbi:Autophagy protein 16 (ATG16) [Musa troglodytarum]|uniref:glycerophosphodiester phosphodiesterase n=1 Tax=Musa troglodytarum TaxID=320322 RepID=A0A9E7L032_9LILI|nr:Autophagy protein 16 (ATG16) [Musa troglodytarum]